MAKKLIVLAGPDEGKSFPLGTEPVMFGRSRATDGYLTDPHVSRVHCQVYPEGDQYIVVDFDSASGTFVNGKELSGKHVLQSGDLIRIGGTHLQFVSAGESSAALSPVKTSADWAKALVGRTFGNYEITAPLARGRMGIIFHARHTTEDTDVALKVLRSEYGNDEKMVQRFIDAMKTAMPLQHAHLLKILGAGKTGNHCWVATDYVQGDSLAAVIGRIEKSGKLDWKGIVRVGVYLARALEFAHSKGLVHQNVTPQNILVGKKPTNTKLTDLMLSRAMEEDPTTPISAAGLPSESLPYMSPERTDGAGATIDSSTDVYSLAATITAMFTGKPPFGGTTVAEVVDHIRLDAAPRVHAVHPQVPDELERLLRHCLAKRPKDRPTSADMRKDLERVATQHTDHAI